MVPEDTGRFRLIVRKRPVSLPVVMKSNPEALRAERERKGHTPRSLERVSGVSKTRIHELEQGVTGIRPTTAKQLAEALGVDIEAIATIEPDAQSDEAVAS